MITIKGLKKQTDCKKCPLMGTDGNPKDLFSPMMCVAIWASTHEIKHCVGGKIRDDCPLVEIGTCKDCEHYFDVSKEDSIGNIYKNSYCQKHGKNVHREDFYCADFEKRGIEND